MQCICTICATYAQHKCTIHATCLTTIDMHAAHNQRVAYTQRTGDIHCSVNAMCICDVRRTSAYHRMARRRPVPHNHITHACHTRARAHCTRKRMCTRAHTHAYASAALKSSSTGSSRLEYLHAHLHACMRTYTRAYMRNCMRT